MRVHRLAFDLLAWSITQNYFHASMKVNFYGNLEINLLPWKFPWKHGIYFHGSFHGNKFTSMEISMEVDRKSEIMLLPSWLLP